MGVGVDVYLYNCYVTVCFRMAIPNEDEWISIFGEVFEELDGCAISKSAHGSFIAENPLVYNTKGEAAYACQNCKRTWHSINGLVEFEYRLLKRNQDYIGDVHRILNGQKCKGDSCKLEFVKPVFTSQSIYFVLEKLLVKVKQKFYESDGEDLSKRFNDLQVMHKPVGRGSHIPLLCKACRKGLGQSKATMVDTGFNVPNFYGRGRSQHHVGRDIFVKWEIRLSA